MFYYVKSYIDLNYKLLWKFSLFYGERNLLLDNRVRKISTFGTKVQPKGCRSANCWNYLTFIKKL